MTQECGRSDPDIKAGNAIGRFMLFYRKIKDQIPEDPPHYHFLLTWEEAQAIIDCFDDTPTLHADMQDVSGKLSEQLKWQARTFNAGFDGCSAGVA